ncbi:protein of unknown function DUF421 [Hymenobacter roseosalivarius DSM 11622]|uniref:DUF421 domain-containing protein n=1 Tax=Hymenobacter roseosalivarius DSM 11622 TaxID=645990 RepID=A0A1W1W1K1_9BACT|nr:YetF domain-containing protein [Hymenobacter roseosalivarius]SMB99360.1 protein of unknown function DUF421 [Hymenobacter roseosalivarius DSM 11622]
MEQFFFSSWTSIIRTLVIGLGAYSGLILLLRLSGKRTLTKMNAFDLIVTVALGSTLATVLLNKSVPLADGMTAFALLIFLQYLITWLSVRSKTISNLVKSEPTLLVYQGAFLSAALKAERVTEAEILAGLREQGVASMTDAAAVILETGGDLSILKNTTHGPQSTLQDVPMSRAKKVS